MKCIHAVNCRRMRSIQALYSMACHANFSFYAWIRTRPRESPSPAPSHLIFLSLCMPASLSLSPCLCLSFSLSLYYTQAILTRPICLVG